MTSEDDLYNHPSDEHGPDEVPNSPFEDQCSGHEQQSEGKQETEILKARRSLKKTPARKPNVTFKDDDSVSSPALSKDPGVKRGDRSLQDIFDGAPPPIAPLTAKGKDSGNSWSPLDDREMWNAEYESLKSNEPSATEALMEDITQSVDQTIDEMNKTPNPALDQGKPTGGGKNKGKKKGKKAGARKASDGDLKAKQIPDRSAEKTQNEQPGKEEAKNEEEQEKAINPPETTDEKASAEVPLTPPPSTPAPRPSVAAMAAKMDKDAAGGPPLRPPFNDSSASLARSSTAGRASGLKRSIAVGEASSRRSSLGPSAKEKEPESPKQGKVCPASSQPADRPDNLPNWGEQDPAGLPVSPEPPAEDTNGQRTVSKHPAQRDDISSKGDKYEEKGPNLVPAPQASEAPSPVAAKIAESKPKKTSPELPKKDQRIEPFPAPATGEAKIPPSTPIGLALLNETKPPPTGSVPGPTEVQEADPTPIQVRVQNSMTSTTAPSPSPSGSFKTSQQIDSLKEIKAAPPGPLKSALRRMSLPASQLGTSQCDSAAPGALPDGPEPTEGPSSPGSPPTSSSIASPPPASGSPLVPDFEREIIHDQELPGGLQRRKSVSFEEQKFEEHKEPSERQSRRESKTPRRTRSSSPKYKRKVIDKAYRQRQRSANSTQADDEQEGEDVVCTSSENWCGGCQQKSTRVSSAVPQRYLDCDPEYYPVTLSCVLHGKTNDAGDIAAAVSKRLSQFTATDVPVHAVVRRAAAGTHRAGKWYDVTTKEGCSTASGKLVKTHQKTNPLEVFFWRWTMNRDERRRKMSHEKRKLRDFRLLIDICIPIEEDGPIELEMVKALPSNVVVQKATFIRNHPCRERLSWWARTHPYVYDRVIGDVFQAFQEMHGFECVLPVYGGCPNTLFLSWHLDPMCGFVKSNLKDEIVVMEEAAANGFDSETDDGVILPMPEVPSVITSKGFVRTDTPDCRKASAVKT
ncbi:hypothetical protein BDV19DRAFT_385310 [Aspergillus venezuelensis]